MISLHFDGLFREAPGGASAASRAGFMCYGWLILREEALIAKGSGVFARGQDASSSAAEYLGLIEGLEALLDLGVQNEAVKVRGDAKSIIEQMQGLALVSSPPMKPLHRRAAKLARGFSQIEWGWTPRRHNREADLLSRRAIRQIRSDPVQYQAVMQAIGPQGSGRQRARLFPLADIRVYQAHGLVF